MNPIQISVPVRRYLKKYVYFVECLEAGEVIDLTNGSHIAYMLGILFQGKTSAFYHSNEDAQHYDDFLPVLINSSRVNDGFIVLSAERLRYLNNFLYRSFHDFLLNRIMTAKLYGTRITEAEVIQDVMHELKIVDDISFDALKKASYRLRKQRDLPLFRPSTSRTG